MTTNYRVTYIALPIQEERGSMISKNLKMYLYFIIRLIINVLISYHIEKS